MTVLPAPGAGEELERVVARLPLVDHHCHGVLAADPDPAGFDRLISEGAADPGGTNFDTPVGLAIRRYCAPLLGLPPHAPPERYLERRRELGHQEVARIFLRASGTERFCVDTGYQPEGLTTPDQLAGLAGDGARAHEVVRLEAVAEAVAANGVEPGEFAAVYAQALDAAVRERGAVGVKSIAAYRTGLAVDPRVPGHAEVTVATARWLERDRAAAGSGQHGSGEHGSAQHGSAQHGSAQHGSAQHGFGEHGSAQHGSAQQGGGEPGGGGRWRLDDPVLTRVLLLTAVEVGLPIQFHVGFGDADIRMHRADPSLLTDWLHTHRVPVMLLHCWPFHRQAAFLAAVHPHVYLDVGLAMHYVGTARAAAVLAETMELSPFRKLLYSSDAFAVAEFYYLGALGFRAALGQVLRERVEGGHWSAPDAIRIAGLAGGGNAARVYRLEGSSADPGAS